MLHPRTLTCLLLAFCTAQALAVTLPPYKVYNQDWKDAEDAGEDPPPPLVVGDMLIRGLGYSGQPANQAGDVIIWGTTGSNESVIPPAPPLSDPPENTKNDKPTYSGTGYASALTLQDLFGPTLGVEPGEQLDNFSVYFSISEGGNEDKRPITVDNLEFSIYPSENWDPANPGTPFITYSLDAWGADNAVRLMDSTSGSAGSDFEFQVNAGLRLSLVPPDSIVTMTLEMSELNSGAEFIWAANAIPLEGNFDFGDAPEDAPEDPDFLYAYGTTQDRGGAMHAIGDFEWLGRRWDSEPDGQPSENAKGDDVTDPAIEQVDDEDGVWWNLTEGKIYVRATVADPDSGRYSTTPGQQLHLIGWMDWDMNGQFDAYEEFVHSIDVPSSADPDWQQNPDGTYSKVYEFDLPPEFGAMPAYHRWRLSYGQRTDPGGYAFAGEVEDHVIVPEPGSLLLLGAGLTLLARRRRRRAR